MSTFKKHVGRIKNTDRRCVVVYMQIPGNEDNALIVDTDALPDRFHDALMDIIDSTEGQATPHLHTLLSRRILPDLGVDMLNALHHYGQLRPAAIDNIVMYPAPNAPCPLRTIVDYVNGEVTTPKETNFENRILENQKADREEANINVAKNILMQAMDLEAEVLRKREQAYRMAPSLRPQAEPLAAPVEPDYHHIESRVTPDHPDLSEGSMSVSDVTENADGTRTFTVEMNDLPSDVAQAYLEALKEEVGNSDLPFPENEVAANQADTSDEAIQAFLDRAAYREDRADREKWEALQPKKPVGRPRKDGLPAGTKPEVAPPAPKKRGRPPKAKPNA